MKGILFGFGSIGQRHYANLKTLRPDCEIYRYDPPKGMRIIDSPTGYDAAIIASPTALHADHMGACWDAKLPFYVEKPLWALPQTRHGFNFDTGETCAVGHQYRFHHAMPAIRASAQRAGEMSFCAYDDLLERYGPEVAGIMASHPIDTALWLLGPAKDVRLQSDGIFFGGEIDHERGRSKHAYSMSGKTRFSTVVCGEDVYDLDANNEMYLDALETWLRWVEGWPRDPRTCTLAEGVAVMEVLAQVKHVSPA